VTSTNHEAPHLQLYPAMWYFLYLGSKYFTRVSETTSSSSH